MGKISINFAEVEGGFKTLPEGRYTCIIDRVEVRESKSSEHNYLNIEFKISEGEHEGQRLWNIASLSPKALFRLKDIFEELGVLDDEMELDWDDDVEVTPGSGPLLIEPDITGMEVEVVVKNEMYQGKEQNRVQEIYAAGGASKKASPKGGGRSTGGRKALR